ncbi:MAG: Lrp/AsnC family transcriptional regulator [Synergistaceae bacterium]|jgi:Lrp/AsnC family leucine-responsive transcriptional regulator|nr:Lrp/AsnC family transcriptional regulator [Synergistaceae bacterium]
MSDKADKEVRNVDEIGWRILEELQKNGRISFKQLAEKVKLSPTAVIERVKRMEEEGIITGYSAAIDPRKVGYSLSALISLSANSGNEQIVNDALASIPEVASCWSLTGTNDYLLEIQVPSLEFLEELLSELARHGRLTTSIVLPSSAKNRLIKSPRISMTD